eukprot:1146161-Pelagomonas_calceolata.AAC.10
MQNRCSLTSMHVASGTMYVPSTKYATGAGSAARDGAHHQKNSHGVVQLAHVVYQSRDLSDWAKPMFLDIAEHAGIAAQVP